MTDSEVIARRYPDACPVRVVARDGIIVSVDDLPNNDDYSAWITPGFCDIQTNGRWGISYSSPDLTVDDVTRIVRAQRDLGTSRLCPTLITAGFDETLHGVRTIAAACEQDPQVGRMVAGIHLEGPWISSVDGYRGAHPLEHARDPDGSEFERWQAACGDRIRLVTLAPERAGALDLISRLVQAGIVVALGHTAADGPTLRAAVTAGASLSTHLGNGIVAQLPRHPNAIWQQAAEDRLSASLIADGHHLDPDTLRVLARAKGPSRTILVSDDSPLAGLAPGTYGPWAVDPSGKVVVAGTPYLAGSNAPLSVGLTNLSRATGWDVAEILATAISNPAALLRMHMPRIEVGQTADLVLVRVLDDSWTVTPWTASAS